MQSALERAMGEEEADQPTREDLLEALAYLRRRFMIVAVLADVFAAFCIAAFIVILVLGTARETGFTLLGVSWILIAGSIGLLVARGLVPVVEEHLQDGD